MSDKPERHYFLPWWMNTFWGRWLCTYWHPAIRLWDTLVKQHAHESAKGELEFREKELLRAADACAGDGFESSSKGALVDAWVNWRNARRDEHAALQLLLGHRWTAAPLEALPSDHRWKHPS